jgi:putative addiction module killer protein
MEYKILEYLESNGQSHYANWFNELDAIVAAKVTVALIRMTQGNISTVKWFRGIGEYKIDFGPGYRIYLAKIGNELILLLGGGTKKTQQKDIDKALSLLAEYKQLKKREK